MPTRLTDHRRRLLHRAAQLEGEHGRPATASELATSLGVRRQSLHEHLQVLRDQGLLEAPAGRSGFVQLTPSGMAVAGASPGVPVVGRIAAGEPILAEHNVETEVDRVRDLLRLDEGDFFLMVHGDSMTGAGIHDGDLVAVHAGRQVLDGEIAVVVVPGEGVGTLKRLYRRGDRVVLESENPAYAPMEFPAREVQVQGRYAGHIALSRPRRSTRHAAPSAPHAEGVDAR